MSKLFPNVSHLKIKRLSWSLSSLPNWVWMAFPKLERFEVSLHDLEGDSIMVDSFFTGISPELCATFESAGASTELMSGLKRTQSYIGDCENLKEFKLNFERSLCSKFASKVAAVRGFKDVIDRTKIIFSFDSVIAMSAGKIEETRRNLDDVAAFVEIRMNK